MMVVVDSKYVFKGIAQRSVKWHRHGWCNSIGEVGHPRHKTGLGVLK